MKPVRITNILNRVTNRKIPIFIIYEIIFAIYLLLEFRDYFFLIWWTIAIGLISLAVLLVIEKKAAPFPFSQSLKIFDYVLWTLIPLAAFLVINEAISYSWRAIGLPMSPILVNSPSRNSALLYVNVGIVEESMKVAITNVLAWPVRRLPDGNKRKEIVIIASGTFSVLVWTYMHVASARYGSAASLYVFLSGIVIFWVIFKKRNFLPTTLAHILLDVV